MQYNPGEISRFDDRDLPDWERGVRQGGLMNKKVMIENAIAFKSILEHCYVDYTLFYGTLLGIIRDGDLISNDSDFDIQCFSRDYIKWLDAEDLLLKEGFRISKRKPLMDEYIIRGGEKIDINWMIPYKNLWIYNSDIAYSTEFFNNRKRIDFAGESWIIPNNATVLLEKLYGSDWKIPQNKKGAYNISS